MIAARPAQTVWTAGNFGELGLIDHLGLSAGGRGSRQNAIGVAVDISVSSGRSTEVCSQL